MVSDLDVAIEMGSGMLSILLLFPKMYYHFLYLKQRGGFPGIDSPTFLFFRPWRGLEHMGDLLTIMWLPIFVFKRDSGARNIAMVLSYLIVALWVFGWAYGEYISVN